MLVDGTPTPELSEYGEDTMKKMLIASVALATLIASPALAQTTNGQTRQAAAEQTAPSRQVPVPTRRARSANPAHDVYGPTGYAGSDPDQHIRSMLAIDNPLSSNDSD